MSIPLCERQATPQIQTDTKSRVSYRIILILEPPSGYLPGFLVDNPL